MVRQGRKPASELAGPEIPPGLRYLWAWFLEVTRTRQTGHAGMQSLTYTEIMAWAMLTDRYPLPYEVDALLALDHATRMAFLDG